ncbi:MAG: ribokinase [Paracoccaceae bacterium]
MTIYNLGSINIDHVYRVDHLPQPGETLAAKAHDSGLGGKGANQSVAIARAGGTVIHIGAIGKDGAWVGAIMANAGVNMEHVSTLDMPTGHAIICVDNAGENAIIIYSSANLALTKPQIDTALNTAKTGDWLLVQNETNLCVYAAKIAKFKGMRVAYAAAPFDAKACAEMIPFTDILALNAIEAAQLSNAMGVGPDALPLPQTLITRGGDGATLITAQGAISCAAFRVDPVDTTGAGDTFLGYFLGHIDMGKDTKTALRFAAAAAALQIGKLGTASAIPIASDVKDFLQNHKTPEITEANV